MSTEEHDEIEERASAWLSRQGFINILVEPKIAVAGNSAGEVAPEKGNPYRTTLTPDVVGYRGTRKVAVECGSAMRPGRLALLRGLGYEVYLWPYDAEEPYKWSEDVNFCRFCGRKFEHLGRMV